jgi:hypothetical protein
MAKKKQRPKWGGRRDGAGRPAIMAGGVYITVRIPAAALEKIDAEAARRGVTRAERLRCVILDGVGL